MCCNLLTVLCSCSFYILWFLVSASWVGVFDGFVQWCVWAAGAMAVPCSQYLKNWWDTSLSSPHRPGAIHEPHLQNTPGTYDDPSCCLGSPVLIIPISLSSPQYHPLHLSPYPIPVLPPLSPLSLGFKRSLENIDSTTPCSIQTSPVSLHNRPRSLENPSCFGSCLYLTCPLFSLQLHDFQLQRPFALLVNLSSSVPWGTNIPLGSSHWAPIQAIPFFITQSAFYHCHKRDLSHLFYPCNLVLRSKMDWIMYSAPGGQGALNRPPSIPWFRRA